MLAGSCGCSGISKKTSDFGYDPETDVLYVDKQVVNFNELSIIASLLWEALNAQYADVYSNPAKVFAPVFSDSEMTLDTYIKEYGLYKELLMLTAFSACFDAENTLSKAEENKIAADASAFYETKIRESKLRQNGDTDPVKTTTSIDATDASKADTKQLVVSLSDTIRPEDCKHVFTMYYKARKYQASLRKAANLVISDEEVRVVNCGIVKSSSETRIREFENDLKKGADFFMLADSTAINELPNTQHAITREDDFPAAILDTIMLLDDKETSSVIECEGAFYILTILDKFDEALSAKNRERMLENMINDYYEKQCADYLDHVEVYFNREGWEDFTLFR